MKFVPYGKLHKKKRKELDQKQRGIWININPVTKRAARSGAYNRKAEKRRQHPEREADDNGSHE